MSYSYAYATTVTPPSATTTNSVGSVFTTGSQVATIPNATNFGQQFTTGQSNVTSLSLPNGTYIVTLATYFVNTPSGAFVGLAVTPGSIHAGNLVTQSIYTFTTGTVVMYASGVPRVQSGNSGALVGTSSTDTIILSVYEAVTIYPIITSTSSGQTVNYNLTAVRIG